MKAFVASGNQGITYHPGIWHHPMVTLDVLTDFTCIVYENGTDGDCQLELLAEKFICHVDE